MTKLEGRIDTHEERVGRERAEEGKEEAEEKGDLRGDIRELQAEWRNFKWTITVILSIAGLILTIVSIAIAVLAATGVI